MSMLALFIAVIALSWSTASAADQPRLGTALNFAVLAGSTITNTGPSVITGDLGLHPGSAVTGMTGPPAGTVTGTQHVADAPALQAKNDLVTAYTDAETAASTATLTGTDLGGQNLVPGVYKYSSSAQLTGTLTLSGNGVFIFQIGSTLTTASNAVVLLQNGAQACAVYWQVGSSATLGSATQFQGNLMALTDINMLTGANILTGRALARNGQLVLQTSHITPPIGTCTVPAAASPTPSGAASPTATSTGPGTSPTPSVATSPTATAPGPSPTPVVGTSPTATSAAAGPTPTPAPTAPVTGTVVPSIGPGAGLTSTVGPTPTPTIPVRLPNTGTAPPQSGIPWWPLAIGGTISAMLLGLMIRTYRRDS